MPFMDRHLIPVCKSGRRLVHDLGNLLDDDGRPLGRQAFAMTHVESQHDQNHQSHDDAVEEKAQQAGDPLDGLGADQMLDLAGVDVRLLRIDAENVVAIRVSDGSNNGGIYGKVGLARPD